MPAATFEVRVEGLEKLQHKLNATLDPTKGFMADLANYTRGQAAIHAKPHPVDKGTLGAGVKVDLASGALPLSARVYTRTMIAYTVEEGRRPGKVKYAPIARWAQRHGIATKPILLVRQIQRSGTAGIHFMGKAEQDARKKAEAMVRDLARQIEERWRH